MTCGNIDFKEIAQGNIANGSQDDFELFARDLLQAVGFKIVRGPARGADDRKDMIVSEKRTGIIGNTEIRYLVSCKHYAHSKNNKSVGNNDEPDVIGRLRNNQCTGFIGFYSTMPSSALDRELTQSQQLNPKDLEELLIFDKSIIASLLDTNDDSFRLYKRYFPNSYIKNMKRESDSQLYHHKPIIRCQLCQKNLLDDFSGQLVRSVLREPKDGDWDYPIPKVRKICFSCDDCLETIQNDHIGDEFKKWPGEIQIDRISSYASSKRFIKAVMMDVSFINAHEEFMAPSAYSIWNKFVRAMFYFVCRKEEQPKEHPNKRKLPNLMKNIFERYEL